ncbi:uncharacterized protein LOC130713191 [Lotus japonicus]|uniref:uncharacterized protein LOC130713191 n=1 Tax=Lotus japonicus TaxID=34305 RepID=UPI00258DC64B|nr:uncharacterized protein LOC130713191 [Lotus japonicus]
MIVLSYNVRGLGSSVKLRALRELVLKEKVDMLLLQETKLEEVNQRICNAIWGSDECSWCYKASEGRSGGILCIWQIGKFNILDSCVGSGFVAMRGKIIEQDLECGVVNVYAPCNATDKRRLWMEINQWADRTNSSCLCVAGDFNAIRNSEERQGSANGVSQCRREMDDFNQFIYDLQLVEPPLVGKRFTWYRSGGQASSRLD